MKRFPMAVFMAIFMCFVAYSQTQDKTSGKMGKTEQQVVALNRAWADAITKTDATALDRLFADDMIVTAGNGGIRNYRPIPGGTLVEEATVHPLAFAFGTCS